MAKHLDLNSSGYRLGLKMPSDDNDAHSGSERDTPAPPRRIIDLELDNDDDDWEDLATLGTSTHRSRNLGHLRIPVNKRKHKLGGKNACACALKKRGSNTSKMKWLGGDLDVLDKELDERAEKLAEKYSMKVKDVRRHMLATSTCKMPRKSSLYNTKTSVIMADLNAGKPSFFFFSWSQLTWTCCRPRGRQPLDHPRGQGDREGRPFAARGVYNSGGGADAHRP
jgi:hypothetical protein